MNEKRQLKRVLAINDLSCFGKCSLTVDLPVLSAFETEAAVLPTSVLSAHTAVFDDYSILDMTDEMTKILSVWESHDLRFDAVMTGYFAKLKQIDICREYIDRHRKEFEFVLVDPVMADNGKLYSGFDETLPPKMRTLLKNADIITPNLTEACLLTETDYSPSKTEREAEEICKKLISLGPKSVAITGVLGNCGTISDIFFDGKNVKTFPKKYSDKRLHGSGDVFAAALCGLLLKGVSPSNAVKKAGEFTYRCISETVNNGLKEPYGLDFEKVISSDFNCDVEGE